MASFMCRDKAVVPELTGVCSRRLAVNLKRCEFIIEVIRIQIMSTLENELGMMDGVRKKEAH